MDSRSVRQGPVGAAEDRKRHSGGISRESGRGQQCFFGYWDIWK